MRAHIESAAKMLATTPRINVLPAPLLHVLGLFDRQVYELIEMRFQTDRPYHVDASKFARRFRGDATSFEDGLRATVDFYAAR